MAGVALAALGTFGGLAPATQDAAAQEAPRREAAVNAPTEAGRIVIATVHGPSLVGSRTGTNPDRTVHVYLPPGYEAGNTRYPVTYLLHGFGGSGAQWTSWGKTEAREGWSIATAMDRLIAAGTVQPMIIVMPDAQVPLIGSMYVDGPDSGGWETFLAGELVAWTDRSFRTLAAPASRAIAGHSMGGYGALRTALRHPDVFGVTYGISPCCLDWGKDLGLENPRAFGPDARFADLAAFQGKPLSYPHLAFAIASGWTPADQGFQPRTPATIAADGTVTVDPAVKALWEAQMPVHTAAADKDAWSRLTIGMEVGSADEYAHILSGTRALSRTLIGLGVRHDFTEHEGRHGDRLSGRVEEAVLPFLSRSLAR